MIEMAEPRPYLPFWKACAVGVGGQGLVVQLGLAVPQHPDLGEHLEVPDHRQRGDDAQQRAQDRQGHRPEDVPGVGTVHGRRLGQLPGHLGQPGVQGDREERQARQTTRAVMTIQPWVESANQLCLVKSTPGIWSMSQFTTPQSASTIQTKIWDETSCGMAQTNIIADGHGEPDPVATRRISSAMPQPEQHRHHHRDDGEVAVRRTTAQNVGSVSSVV